MRLFATFWKQCVKIIQQCLSYEPEWHHNLKYHHIWLCCNGTFLPLSTVSWRGIVLPFQAGGWTGRQTAEQMDGWAPGSRLCETHIAETTGWIFFVWISMKLSWPEFVQCCFAMCCFSPMCCIWAGPWTKHLSNFAPAGSRLCSMHISGTAV